MTANNESEKSISANTKHLNRLTIAVAALTLVGIGLFAYFLYSVGLAEVLEGIRRIGFDGFAIVILLYFARIVIRAVAWDLAVHEPYRLRLRDTVPAVIIGEALSSVIPLGIVVSGTAKAIAVKKRLPLVVGLSSVATENLFYSLATGLFIAFGAAAMLRSFDLSPGLAMTIDLLIAGIVLLLVFGILLVVRQWHIASAVCDWLYDRGHLRGILEHGRLQVRLFENLIFGFYRRYPRRFIPILGLEFGFHIFGVLEAWIVLTKLGETATLFNSLLLESASRLVAIVFKLVPFVIGVDEAGAHLVTDAIGIAAGAGLTLAIIRKGRILFWAILGALLILSRGMSLREINKLRVALPAERPAPPET